MTAALVTTVESIYEYMKLDEPFVARRGVDSSSLVRTSALQAEDGGFKSPIHYWRNDMLRITLEMVPFGIEERKRTIGEMTIGNISPGFNPNDDMGDYTFTLTDNAGEPVEMKFRKWPRPLGAWRLVQAILQLVHGPLPIEKTKDGGRYYPGSDGV